jgi:hypothetical protein
MNFVLATLAYLVLGILITLGLIKAVTGSYVLLLLGLVVFFGLFIKYGCLSSHD